MKQAKVTCPKCQHQFMVRQVNQQQMHRASPELQAALDSAFASMNKAFDTMDAVFMKLFDRKLWR